MNTQPNPNGISGVADNPGLAPFELSNYTGLDGQNFYLAQPVLRRFLAASLPAEDWTAVDGHLRALGELTGGRLNTLIRDAHREGKYGTLQKFDRHGERIDEIIYCTEQKEARRLAFEAGIVNLDRHPAWGRPFHYEHREACAYLINMNGEGGIACPLAMTEGMIEFLRAAGTPEQQAQWLPLITDPESGSHFMAGQYLTERVGGSNVGKNRTIAYPSDETGKRWRLVGEKWFCSNPGDVWVTTARFAGSNTIGVFLMGRRRADGSINGHHILRLKDIIGSRGKVTAEIEYRDAEAELIGRRATGLATLMHHVIAVSRIHTGLGATAGARRAFLEARAYSRIREAFGQTIGEYTSVRRLLSQMQSLLCAIEWGVFTNWSLRARGDKASEILTPLYKYIGTSRGTEVVHQAILIHGGNGILGDYSILPRLLNDAVINETWEGTHQIIAGHVAKAFGRKNNQAAFFALVDARLARYDATRGENNISAAREMAVELRRELSAIHIPTLDEADQTGLCENIFLLDGISHLLGAATNGEGNAIFAPMADILAHTVAKGWSALPPASHALRDREIMAAIINE